MSDKKAKAELKAVTKTITDFSIEQSGIRLIFRAGVSTDVVDVLVFVNEKELTKGTFSKEEFIEIASQIVDTIS